MNKTSGEAESFLLTESQTITLAEQCRVQGTHEMMKNECSVAQSCASKIAGAKTLNAKKNCWKTLDIFFVFNGTTWILLISSVNKQKKNKFLFPK